MRLAETEEPLVWIMVRLDVELGHEENMLA